MPFDLWSKTASLNSSIDPTINLAEGMAPSAVNDSCRAIMARLAEFRDDTSGLLSTAGTATAYTLASNQGLPTIPNDGQLIAFSPHVVNGINPTLTVDGGTTYPIQSSSGVAVTAATLVAGSPYMAKFSLPNLAWMLCGFYANPINIPLAGGMDYWGLTVPNSNFAFPIGQAISRTTYSALFALIGISYGGGDGSTTFNIPDKRGRVSAGLAFMGGPDSGRLSNGSMSAVRNTLGAGGGLDTEVLTLAQIPTGITASGNNSISVTSGANVIQGGVAGSSPGGGTQATQSLAATFGPLVSTGNNNISVTSNNTGGGQHDNLQPMILCNYIMRIL